MTRVDQEKRLNAILVRRAAGGNFFKKKRLKRRGKLSLGGGGSKCGGNRNRKEGLTMDNARGADAGRMRENL